MLQYFNQMHIRANLFFLFIPIIISIRPNEVHLGGMFSQFLLSQSYDRVGSQSMAAFLLAIDQINNKTDDWSDNILPQTKVLFEIRDSKRDFGVSTLEAVYLANDAFGGTGVTAVVGPPSSSPAIAAQNIFKLNIFRIPQIAYSASSPALSNTALYDSFARTALSDVFQAGVMVTLIKYFGYTAVSTIGGNDAYSTFGVAAFVDSAETAGIKVVASQEFVAGSNDISQQVAALKAADCKLVVMFAQVSDIATVLIEAHSQGFTGNGIVWILSETALVSGGLPATIFSSPANKHLKIPLNLTTISNEIVNGAFATGASEGKGTPLYQSLSRIWSMLNPTATSVLNGNSIVRGNCSDVVDRAGRYVWRKDGAKDGICSGIDFSKYSLTDCSSTLCNDALINNYVPSTYDATIAILRAVHDEIEAFEATLVAQNATKVINLKSVPVRSSIFKRLKAQKFIGMSGSVAFDAKTGDRIGIAIPYRIYNHNAAIGGDSATFKWVGSIQNNAFTSCSQLTPILPCAAQLMFSDGSNSPPATYNSRNTCQDDIQWKDNGGYGCDAYIKYEWCSNGKAGLGWVADWGSFSDFGASDSSTAVTKCCACRDASFTVNEQGSRWVDQYAVSIIMYLTASFTLFLLFCRLVSSLCCSSNNINKSRELTSIISAHSAKKSLAPIILLECSLLLLLQGLFYIADWWRRVAKDDVRVPGRVLQSPSTIFTLVTKSSLHTKKDLRQASVLITVLFLVFGIVSTSLSEILGLRDLAPVLSYIYPLFWSCLLIAVTLELKKIETAMNILDTESVVATTTTETPLRSRKSLLARRLTIFGRANIMSGMLFCIAYLVRQSSGKVVWLNICFDISCFALVVSFIYLIWGSIRKEFKHSSHISHNHSEHMTHDGGGEDGGSKRPGVIHKRAEAARKPSTGPMGSIIAHH